MSSYKGFCPCGDFEFFLKYPNPDEEDITLYCPFCSAKMDEEETEIEEEDEE